MAQPDRAASIQIVRSRFSRLNSDGTSKVGATNAYVTKTLITANLRVENASGDEIEQKNGAGIVCATYRSPDRFKRILIDLQLCTPDPQLIQMLAGGTVLTGSAPDPVQPLGYTYPLSDGSDTNDDGVSAEMWTRAIVNGAQASDFPWFRHILSRAKFFIGDKELANAAHVSNISGYTEENPSLGDGPFNDFPAWAAGKFTAPGFFRDTAANYPADNVVGAVAVPAQP